MKSALFYNELEPIMFVQFSFKTYFKGFIIIMEFFS